jgi:hypothetical protein
MECCSTVLHSGNPAPLTAWSYAVASTLLSCMVLHSGNPCSLATWSDALLAILLSCTILCNGNLYSLTTWSYAVSSMFLSCMVLRRDNPCFLTAQYHQCSLTARLYAAVIKSLGHMVLPNNVSCFPKLVLWVTSRLYYPISTYIPIIGVCCMIFHNSIPGHFTIMHNIIEVVAWSYAITFYLSATLM